MNRVCEILNIKYPVIQGPMAWISSSELVAAVSNAGGLGVLGTSADSTEIVREIQESVEEMRKAIRNTKALTDKPFGINVFPEAGDPYGFSKAMIELAKKEGVMILVCYDMDTVWKNPSDRYYRSYNSGEQDASIAATTMMYEAEELGVHSIWIRGFDSKSVVDAFNLPENIIPVMFYPNEKSKAHAWHYRNKPMEEMAVEL